MAEAGVGVQLLEIERMERALKRCPALTTRFFTEAERAHCSAAVRPAARYAGCLAARSAVYKALGLELGPGSTRWDVSVEFAPDGVPRVLLAGRALEVAAAQGVEEVAISLSYTGRMAVANALVLTAAVRPQPKAEQADERALIARSFREVRSVLDELERVQEDDLIPTAGPLQAAEQEVQGETGTEH